jgi:cytochrome c-type biogenesis protein CcmE
MTARQRRLAWVAAILSGVGLSALVAFKAFDKNLLYFVDPSQVVAGKAPQGKSFRIGGMVKDGSVKRDGLTVHFVITDLVKDIPVSYTGILPDLFKEGKGAVIQGRLNPNGEFVASEVLAKHDENYMPPEAKHALEQAQKNGSNK